jgi:hypothetical protein
MLRPKNSSASALGINPGKHIMWERLVHPPSKSAIRMTTLRASK